MVSSEAFKCVYLSLFCCKSYLVSVLFYFARVTCVWETGDGIHKAKKVLLSCKEMILRCYYKQPRLYSIRLRMCTKANFFSVPEMFWKQNCTQNNRQRFGCIERAKFLNGMGRTKAHSIKINGCILLFDCIGYVTWNTKKVGIVLTNTLMHFQKNQFEKGTTQKNERKKPCSKSACVFFVFL